MSSKFYKIKSIFSLCLISLFLNAAEFISTDNQNYSYIFAPGLNSTETQLAKYL